MPPGISRDVMVEVPEDVQQRFIAYVNRGDLISKVGKLFGRVFEVSTAEMMKPIYAHTVLMSAHDTFNVSEVAVRKENARRTR